MTSVARLIQPSGSETGLAEVLAGILGVEQVSLDGHFFDELGADSMMMAQFCARVRKRADLPAVSMKEVYRNPTIRLLAATLDAAPGPSPAPASIAEPAQATTPVGAAEYVLCGTLQLLSLFGAFYLCALVVAPGYEWMSAGSGLIDVYVRAVMFGGAVFVGLCGLPILAKWVLIGRWKPGRLRIWSLAYFRFWLVKTLIQSNPLVLFVGSPIYVLYLKALGAKIGRNVVIFSRYVPVCTDLLAISDGAVVRKGSFFTCYRARAGMIEFGPVSLGREALVGEAAVLDIDTSLGDGAQLGHSSSLHAGHAVPDGERRAGSPADQRTGVDYRLAGLTHGGTRRIAYAVFQLAVALLFTAPLAAGGLLLLIEAVPRLGALQADAASTSSSWTLLGGAMVLSFGSFFGLLLASLLFVMTVPRLLNLAIKPDTIYPLYGFHYWAHRRIAGLTNIAFFPRLLGDSSYIVPYLSWLGYDLSKVEQTGSNFGLELRHETPFLVTVGTGTMAADGLSIINADYSSTSFRVSRATIGARSFIGNYVGYPSQAKTGDDCLLATKVLVPVEGAVREGTGLLGSPEFEIPRSVDRDRKLDHLTHGDGFRRRLAAKNKHNALTIALYLLTWWIFFFELTVVAWAAAEFYGSIGASAIALAGLFGVALGVAHFALVERLSTMFRPLQPRYCSIYEPYFWFHERYWKLATQPLILNGTPFKTLAWRLLGVRIGARVFDDGCIIMEKTLVEIGDGCALNVGSIVQPHSQENGAFKSDRISIGAGCTLGTSSLVHYGVTIGEGATLAPDSFLMKGEEIPARASWGGNPAKELRGGRSAVAVASIARLL